MVNVTVSSEVGELTVENGVVIELEYEDQTNEGGEVDRYQCASCGETISEGRVGLTADNPAFSPVDES
jgi:hypothetical protein